MLDATHTEMGYKETALKITWKKEAELILKRLLSMRRNGVLYSEVFMQPVDPDLCVPGCPPSFPCPRCLSLSDRLGVVGLCWSFLSSSRSGFMCVPGVQGQRAGLL